MAVLQKSHRFLFSEGDWRLTNSTSAGDDHFSLNVYYIAWNHAFDLSGDPLLSVDFSIGGSLSDMFVVAVTVVSRMPVSM